MLDNPAGILIGGNLAFGSVGINGEIDCRYRPRALDAFQGYPSRNKPQSSLQKL
jgi:hypothetical protein